MGRWADVSGGWQKVVGVFFFENGKSGPFLKKDLCLFWLCFRKIGCLISWGEGMRILFH